MCGQRVSRKPRFVQNHHRSAGAGEGDRGGSTRAASPDDDDVDGFDRTCGHGFLRFQGWRISKFRVALSIVITPWVHGLPPSERSLLLKSGTPRVPKSRSSRGAALVCVMASPQRKTLRPNRFRQPRRCTCCPAVPAPWGPAHRRARCGRRATESRYPGRCGPASATR